MIRGNRKDLFLKIAGSRYILDYVACSGDNSYLSRMRPHGPMHTVRRRNRPVQISQLSRLRFYLEGGEGSGSRGQRLQASTDGIERVCSYFQPRNTSACCLISTALPRPNQRSKVNRRQRTKNKKRHLALNSRKPSRRRLHRRLSKTFAG